MNQSDQLANAERLKSFLTYVVEETIAGRSDRILGKTIAQDVYFLGTTKSAGGNNLVRVDAGRLRRKLQEYYETTGINDTTRIHIDSGGYAPWFEDLEPQPSAVVQPPTEEPSRARFGNPRLLIALSLIVVALLGAGILFVGLSGKESNTNISPARVAERQALSSKSMATVHAANLCDQARGLLFPIANIQNQILATEMFKHAIESDPEFVCGYSGAAHSLATQSILTPPGDKKLGLVAEALAMSGKAIELDPSNGWSQSASAWAAYANQDIKTALKRSSLAEKLQPNDGNILDFRGLLMIVTGNFQEAYKASDPDRPRELGSYRFAHRNLHAVANYHLGNYRTTITSLNRATEEGDPVSALTLVFLAASYQGEGEQKTARSYILELQQTWPDFRPDKVLNAFYFDPRFAAQVTDKLKAAGWQELR